MKAPRLWDDIPPFAGPYAAYLESDEWAMRRAAVRWSARHRCERCGSKRRPQHVHHLTYERLGHERRSDLQLLCENCHRAAHDIAPATAGMHSIAEVLERQLRSARRAA